jgi:hypothetical protein
MADPQIPGGIRVQHILPGKSAMPEDRYITTWAFRKIGSGAPTNADLENAGLLVSNFFSVVNSPAVANVASFLAAAVNRPLVETRSYTLQEPPPREPLTVVRPLGPNNSSNSMPSEVAMCASFYSGRNLPRQRGRVYIGPLTQASADTTQGGTGRVLPTPALVFALVEAMRKLQTNAIDGGLNWCVLSQADQALKSVTAGWVDNAFDTQRRRGEDATSREAWSAAVTP